MFVPVADSVSGSVLTGLRKCYISLHRIIPTQTALVGDEFRSTAGVLVVQVGSHQSAPLSASMAESSAADSVQAGRSYIQMCPRNGTDVSGRWTFRARGSLDQNSPMIGVDHITACPLFVAVDCRRPSFSCRRCPHLERPATHVTPASSLSCFCKPSSGVPFRNFCSSPAKWRSSLLTL